MPSGLGRVEMEASHCMGFCVTSKLCMLEMDANKGRRLCLTSKLGNVKIKATNWVRFLCDIWAGQGGNGGK